MLWLAGLGFLGFGVAFLIDPVAPMAAIGFDVADEAGVTELRAFYGGMETGLALFILACALRPAWRTPGLWLVLLTNAGAGSGRLLSILAGAQASGFDRYALLWEFGFALLAAGALLLGRRAGT